MEGLMKPLKMAIFFLFFAVFLNIFSDAIDDATKLYNKATEHFNQAEEFFNKANALAKKGDENLTIEEINKETDYYSKATSLFNLADNEKKEANQLLAQAEASLNPAPAKPKPKPKPVKKELTPAQKKAKSRALAMRARAKVQVLMRRMAAEKERVKTFQKRAGQMGLKYDDNEKGPAFDFIDSFKRKSSELSKRLTDQLDKLAQVFQGFPDYYIDVKVFSSDYDDPNKDIKLSKQRCENIEAYLLDLGISNYDINIVPKENKDNKHSNITKVVFYREADYFRR